VQLDEWLCGGHNPLFPIDNFDTGKELVSFVPSQGAEQTVGPVSAIQVRRVIARIESTARRRYVLYSRTTTTESAGPCTGARMSDVQYTSGRCSTSVGRLSVPTRASEGTIGGLPLHIPLTVARDAACGSGRGSYARYRNSQMPFNISFCLLVQYGEDVMYLLHPASVLYASSRDP
jgi:hypothetical protein